MTHAAVGISTERNTVRAALEAAREAAEGLGGRQTDWCIVFVSTEHRDHLRTLIESISGVLETPYVIGCSAAGVVSPDREIDHGPIVGLIAVSSEHVRATPFLFHDEGDHGLTAGIRLAQRLATSRGSNDLLLVLPDPFSVRPDHLLRAVDAVLGPIPAVGGAPSAAPPGAPTFQFCGTEVSDSAVSGLRLGGRFRYHVGVTHGSVPLGPPLRVTRAHDNLLLELEGRPAFEMLRTASPEDLDPVENSLAVLFVGIMDEPVEAGSYTVRNIVSADPDTGLLAVADSVEEGQHIVFLRRHAEAARRELARVLTDLAPARTGIEYGFGLYFNCVARGRSLYGESGVDAALLAQYLPGLPVLGLFSNAEIGPVEGQNRLLTYSGVIVLVGE